MSDTQLGRKAKPVGRKHEFWRLKMHVRNFLKKVSLASKNLMG